MFLNCAKPKNRKRKEITISYPIDKIILRDLAEKGKRR